MRKRVGAKAVSKSSSLRSFLLTLTAKASWPLSLVACHCTGDCGVDCVGTSAFAAGTGTSYTLTGTGFAEGAQTSVLGNTNWEDIDRYSGDDASAGNTRLSGTAPVGVSRSVVQVRTAGGTSMAFATGQA
jgi:hypothetical protein